MKRLEHPNPQFMRDSYICLNGKWEFEMGKISNVNAKLNGEIEVPFCVESKLSGVGYTDFVSDCAYGKVVTLTEEDLKNLDKFSGKLSTTIISSFQTTLSTYVDNPNLSDYIYDGFTPIVKNLSIGFYPVP
jgi:hypothetical protein